MRIQINIKMAKDKFADTFCFMLCYREFLIFFTASSTSLHAPSGTQLCDLERVLGNSLMEQFKLGMATQIVCWIQMLERYRRCTDKLRKWRKGSTPRKALRGRCICYVFMYSRVIST